MEKNLLPIGQIAKTVKTDKIHLAYLTKLGLLPQTIRRKIAGKMTGCYPDWAVSQIRKIEDLKNSGLAYSQIKTPAPVYNLNPLALLIIGLLLGYILATSNPSTSLRASQQLATSFPPLDETSSTMLKVLIAVPKQNLYKLGQININELAQ